MTIMITAISPGTIKFLDSSSGLNQTLGLTPQKAELNYHTLGNIGPAAVPITLSLAEKKQTIKKGDHVALLGIGSGLNCSMMSISW